MKNEFCSHCNSKMDMIDSYDRFLEPDQMIDNFPIEITEKQFVINIKIYKCSNCGSHRAVYGKGENFVLVV